MIKQEKHIVRRIKNNISFIHILVILTSFIPILGIAGIAVGLKITTLRITRNKNNKEVKNLVKINFLSLIIYITITVMYTKIIF